MQGTRYITDRFEWESLVLRLGPDAYHHPSWARTSARRVEAHLRIPCEASYLRVWMDDSLICCPILRTGPKMDRAFNAPRTSPTVLSGPPLDRAEVVARLRADVRHLDIHDDTAQQAHIDSVHARLAAEQASSRTFRSITCDDVDEIVDAVRWAGPHETFAWTAAIRSVDRASWDITFVRHLDVDQQPIGWSCSASIPGRESTRIVVFAVVAGEHVYQWGSPR